MTRKDYVLIADAIRTRIIDNDPTWEERGIALIDTDGRREGQINGLSVFSLGDYSFGKSLRHGVSHT